MEDKREDLETGVAQSLIAIGLYTVSFEATLLSFKGKVSEYLLEYESSRIHSLENCGDNAYKIIKFCGDELVKQGVVLQIEIERLQRIRYDRNSYAHKRYNKILELKIQDIIEDVSFMDTIVTKVKRWKIIPVSPRSILETIKPLYRHGFSLTIFAE